MNWERVVRRRRWLEGVLPSLRKKKPLPEPAPLKKNPRGRGPGPPVSRVPEGATQRQGMKSAG
jgi:hypothetical protein